MDKVLVTLEVPCIGESYEIKLPLSLRVKEVLCLLTDSVADLSEGRYRSSGMEVLLLRETREVLRNDTALCDLGIVNGSRLILM